MRKINGIFYGTGLFGNRGLGVTQIEILWSGINQHSGLVVQSGGNLIPGGQDIVIWTGTEITRGDDRSFLVQIEYSLLPGAHTAIQDAKIIEIGRASCRERAWR